MNKLFRSRHERVIAGVCGGLGEYFHIDPVIIRVIFVVLFFVGGSALLGYLIAWIIIPQRPTELETVPAEKAESTHPEKEAAVSQTQSASSNVVQSGALIIGIILIVIGALLLMRNLPFFHHYYWWFWARAWRFFWPAVIVMLGIIMIIRGTRKG